MRNLSVIDSVHLKTLSNNFETQHVQSYLKIFEPDVCRECRGQVSETWTHPILSECVILMRLRAAWNFKKKKISCVSVGDLDLRGFTMVILAGSNQAAFLKISRVSVGDLDSRFY